MLQLTRRRLPAAAAGVTSCCRRLSSLLLTPAEQEFRTRQRAALLDLEHTLVRLDASSDDTTTLRESITLLDSLFLCCVVGEFNAGKSALLNALLATERCEEGVLPTTSAVCLIKHPSVAFEPSHAARTPPRTVGRRRGLASESPSTAHTHNNATAAPRHTSPRVEYDVGRADQIRINCIAPYSLPVLV